MRLLMMGTGTFAGPTFDALLAAFPGQVVGLVTQPDRDGAKARGSSRLAGNAMIPVAAAAGLPVQQPVSINKDGLEAFQALKPDLCVVAAYGQILSRAVIETPPLGMINVHASLLPKYRGASPIAHAILNGETRTGVTILRVVPGLDAGDILATAETDIGPAETTGELEARLAPIGAELCVGVVRRLLAGERWGTPQDPALVTKAPKFTKESGLIDWAEPAAVIARKVRAFQPWPTAYTFLHRPGRPPLRVQVTKVAGESVTCTSFFPAQPRPGDLLGGTVFTGKNELVLGEVQPAGGKRMPAAAFANGYLCDGARFGPESLS